MSYCAILACKVQTVGFPEVHAAVVQEAPLVPVGYCVPDAVMPEELFPGATLVNTQVMDTGE